MMVTLEPGTRIGEFEVEALVASGPLSQIYRAMQPALQRAVALKVLSSDVAEDAIFRERFLREARALARLEHEHIVPVYEAGLDGDRLFLAMEFVNGGTLRDLIADEGRLSLERALGILAPVGEALDHVHRLGFVHRDVQSGNILISDDGAVYLSDFLLVADLRDSALTRPGQALGKASYVAPEQIRGERVGAPTDVYMLGCVAFECLTGAPPFADRDKPMRRLWAQLQDEAPKPSEANPSLPAAIDTVFRTALAKEPDNRYATASDLITALTATL